MCKVMRALTFLFWTLVMFVQHLRYKDSFFTSKCIFIQKNFFKQIFLKILKSTLGHVTIVEQCARIAQSVERPAVNRQVTGSSPVSGAIVCGRLVKRLNTPPFHGGTSRVRIPYLSPFYLYWFHSSVGRAIDS